MAAMEWSDAELLDRWRQGQRDAGKALFERYYDTLECFFANKVPTGVGDLVQETFRMCLEARDRIADPAKFRPYLFSIAFNVLRGHFRKKSRRGTEIDLDEVTVEALAPGPRSVLVEREEQRLLLEALRSIPVSDQVILELDYWESLKIDDIAQILGVPLGTAKSRLHRARQRLREAMERIAESPELLHSTLADLDDWARHCRQQLGRASAI
jgi:RNA polymerase sigma-70 factor (ECF subfamily)